MEANRHLPYSRIKTLLNASPLTGEAVFIGAVSKTLQLSHFCDEIEPLWRGLKDRPSSR